MRKPTSGVVTTVLVAAALALSFLAPVGRVPASEAAGVDAAHPYEFVTGSFEAKKDAGISFLISNPSATTASVVLQLFTSTTQVGSNFTVNVQSRNTLTAILFATATGLHFAKLSSSVDDVVVQYRYVDAASVTHFVDAGHVRAITPKATGLFVPVNPFRLCNTLDGQGTACQGKTIGANGTLNVVAAGVGGIPGSGVIAVALAGQTVSPTGSTSYLTFWPDLTTRPLISQMTFVQGEKASNTVLVKLGTNGRFNVFNKNGSTDVILDVVGYYV